MQQIVFSMLYKQWTWCLVCLSNVLTHLLPNRMRVQILTFSLSFNTLSYSSSYFSSCLPSCLSAFIQSLHLRPRHEEKSVKLKEDSQEKDYAETREHLVLGNQNFYEKAESQEGASIPVVQENHLGRLRDSYWWMTSPHPS